MTTPMHPQPDAVSNKANAKSRFLETYRREYATTKKVLDAYPAEQGDFKPHETSNSAKGLLGTFIAEGHLALRALRGEQMFGAGMPKAPESWDALRAAFDAMQRETEAEVAKASPDLAGTVAFPKGPKQMGEYSVEDFLWFMLHDHIHHRGQLSVYLRMVGAKVPSIYGPSKDEPWT